MQIKILGIGHSLRGDDEVGLEIVQRWQDSHMADHPDYTIEAETAESPGLTLLGLIAGLDAVQSPAGEASIPRAVKMINEILGELLEFRKKVLFDKIFKLLSIR